MKQHANHGRDHLETGMDPTFHPKHMLIKMSSDLHTPFTVSGTNEFTDAWVTVFIPPDLDGWYVVDAQAFVHNASDSGDIHVELYNKDKEAWVLGNGTTREPLVIDESLLVGHIASDDDILTTLQMAAGERLRVYCIQTDAAALGLTVWLKFGKSMAIGANAPEFD